MTALKNVGRNDDLATGLAVYPAGFMLLHASDTLPAGWLWCRGGLVNTSDQPELDALFGAGASSPMTHAFNNGSLPASGKFRLPDLRSAAAAGVSSGDSLVGVRAIKSSAGGSADPLTTPPIFGSWAHTHPLGSLAIAAHQHPSGFTVAGHGHTNATLFSPDHAHLIGTAVSKLYQGSSIAIEVVMDRGDGWASTSTDGGRLPTGGIIDTRTDSHPSSDGNIAVANSTGDPTAAPGLTGTLGTANPPSQTLNYIIKSR